jgi:phosphate transport system substrate-binding protein
VKTNTIRAIFILVLTMLGGLLAGCRPDSGDPNAPVAAYIQNKGSDTIVNLALAWAERYQQVHPEVRISVTGGGSGTGLASLINGTVDIANASRAIKDEETEDAMANGIEPVETVIARDAIAVIVNHQNPVANLTLEQISQIYRGEINNWIELGGEDRPIVRLSRETNSGTHVYFLEEVIRLGQADNHEIFSANTLLLPSSEGIISEVRDNPNAIGYDGLGYVTEEVKVLGIARDKDREYVLPSIETVNSAAYPIARDLYMYSHKDAGQVVLDYLKWLLSAEAQQIVGELGFVPVIIDPNEAGEP